MKFYTKHVIFTETDNKTECDNLYFNFDGDYEWLGEYIIYNGISKKKILESTCQLYNKSIEYKEVQENVIIRREIFPIKLKKEPKREQENEYYFYKNKNLYEKKENNYLFVSNAFYDIYKQEWNIRIYEPRQYTEEDFIWLDYI